MDRVTTYYGALARAVDVLKTNQNVMVGLSVLAQSVLGSATLVDGFTLAPTSPASLNVVLSPGQIYQQAPLESTPLSALPVDTHVILKQGIALDSTPQTLVPPGTIGQAVNVLVQVQYQDADTDTAILNYYNAADPTTPLRGPGNNGQAQSTVRRGAVAVASKYGVPAAAGSQATPNPDAGWAGLYVVTLSYGQTAISAGNIARYAGIPLIGAKLGEIPTAVQSNTWNYAIDTGSSGLAINAGLFPVPLAIGDGFVVSVKLARNLVPGASLTVNSNSGAVTGSILRQGNTAFGLGDFNAGDIVDFVRNGTNWIIRGNSQTLSVIDTAVVRTIGGSNPDFSTLLDAVTWLSRRRILPSGSVTFRLAAGVGVNKLLNTTQTNVTHPDAAYVFLLGQSLNGPLTQPGNLTYSGTSSSARASDTAANLAALRAIYNTELFFANGSNLSIIGNIGNVQDVLITSDASGVNVPGLNLFTGTQTLTRVAVVNASGHGIVAQGNQVTFNGICHSLGNGGNGYFGQSNSSAFVPVGAQVSGCANGQAGIVTLGTLTCVDLTTQSILFARGNAVDGILANGGTIVASSSSKALNNANGYGFYCVNCGVMRAQGCQSDGNLIGFVAGQNAYMDATNTSGSSLNVAFLGFQSGRVNRVGSTATGNNGVSSPAVGSTGSDGGAVY